MTSESDKQSSASAWNRLARAARAGAGELLARVRAWGEGRGWRIVGAEPGAGAGSGSTVSPRPSPLGSVGRAAPVAALVEACRRDPKKATVFAVLAVVLASMWVRMMVGGAGGDGAAGPASALAALTRHPGGAGASGEGASRREAAVDAAVSDWRNTPVLPPRNLFAVRFDYFPRDGSRAAEPVRGGEGFWAELGKSLASRTDEKKQRQVLIENLQLQAAKLRLETTMMGARPTAVINGEMLGEGDVVASGSGVTRMVFRVSRIEARRVIVEREGIKLEIPMK